MTGSEKLMKLARKWKKMVAIGRKTISLPQISKEVGNDSSNKSPVAEKGHFVIYTLDQRRYAIPLVYLSTNIFRELFKMSEEEFGISSDRPITLPCDAVCMDYVVSLIKHGVIERFRECFSQLYYKQTLHIFCYFSSGTYRTTIIGLQLLKN